MSDATVKLLAKWGWSIECESPFEIRHGDGSFATQQAAAHVVESLSRETTKDFGEHILSKLANNPELAERVEKHTFNARIAIKIHELRTNAGLSRKKLAELAGTKRSVIVRIENTDCDCSLDLLRRIAKALGKKLDVLFSDHVGASEFCGCTLPEADHVSGSSGTCRACGMSVRIYDGNE